MMRGFTFLLALAAIYALVAPASACVFPKSGWSASYDQTIDMSDIYVVELAKAEPRFYGEGDNRTRNGFKNTLHIVEVLKGDKKIGETFEFHTSTLEHSYNHFNSHTDEIFWSDESNGRAEWPCCICGPDFSFRDGERYLYFPDALGSVYAAEVVLFEDDKWLQYVRARLAAQNETD